MVTNMLYEPVYLDTIPIAGKNLCLPISLPLPLITQSFLGNKLEEQKERMASIICWAMKSGCRSFTIEIVDHLQRFTVMNAKNISEENAVLFIKEISEPFFQMLTILIKESKDYQIANKLPPIEINLVRWINNLEKPEMQSCRSLVEEQYKSNKEYSTAIETTALNFQRGSHVFDISPKSFGTCYERSIVYILEECAVYLGWKYDVIFYPAKATEAISKTYEIFIKNREPKILHYVQFKLTRKEHLAKPADLAAQKPLAIAQQLAEKRFRIEFNLSQQSVLTGVIASFLQLMTENPQYADLIAILLNKFLTNYSKNFGDGTCTTRKDLSSECMFSLFSTLNSQMAAGKKEREDEDAEDSSKVKNPFDLHT